MSDLTVKTIQIREGDTLWAIAERHLGNGQRWRDVFMWNVIAMMEQSKVPQKISADYIIPGHTIKLLTKEPVFEESGN